MLLRSVPAVCSGSMGLHLLPFLLSLPLLTLSSPKNITAPFHLPSIPDSFSTHLTPSTQTPLLPALPLYLASILASTHVAVNAPNVAYEGRTYGLHAHGEDVVVQIIINPSSAGVSTLSAARDGVIARRGHARRDSVVQRDEGTQVGEGEVEGMQTRHVLWALWDCLAGIVAASGSGFPGTGEMQGGECVVEMPKGVRLGTLQYVARARVDGDVVAIANGTTSDEEEGERGNGNTASATVPAASEAGNVFARSPVQAGEREAPSPRSFSLAQNGTETMGWNGRAEVVDARIYPIGGAALAVKNVAFTLLAAVIDMAVPVPTRPHPLPQDWEWDYNSPEQGVYVSLRARRGEKSVLLGQAARGLWALAHEMDVRGLWEECDFVVLLDRREVFDGRLRKSVQP